MSNYYVIANDSSGNEGLWDSKTVDNLNVPMSYQDAMELASEIAYNSDYTGVQVVAAQDYSA